MSLRDSRTLSGMDILFLLLIRPARCVAVTGDGAECQQRGADTSPDQRCKAWSGVVKQFSPASAGRASEERLERHAQIAPAKVTPGTGRGAMEFAR
jgi:hypothetical protein